MLEHVGDKYRQRLLTYLWARFIFRVNEVLDLGHLKFTDSKHAVLGRDFVSVRNTNLRAGKWEFLVVVIVPVNDQFEVRASMQPILSREANVQALEREEDTLRRLWSQEAFVLAGRSDLGRKHHVEVFRLRQIVPSLW